MAEQDNNVKIKLDDAVSLINYLSTRPYADVFRIMPVLSKAINDANVIESGQVPELPKDE